MNPHGSLFSQYPLVQFAIPFCVGVCVVEYGPRAGGVYLVAGVICSILALVAVLKHRLTFAGWALLAAMFFVGAVLASPERRTSNFAEGQTITFTGVLDRAPEYVRDRVYLSVKGEHGFDGSVFLFAPGERDFRALDLRYGTRVRVMAKLMRTDSYRNPGVSPLSEYLERKGYAAMGRDQKREFD